MIFTPISMGTLIDVLFAVGFIGLFIIMLIPERK
jgi:hypothetical protein